MPTCHPVECLPGGSEQPWPLDTLALVSGEVLLLAESPGADGQPLARLALASFRAPCLLPSQPAASASFAEATSQPLQATELVVLSACSTGQGEARTGEGVYGLQRALALAGARSTLLSLWKVDDQAAREFMVRFYALLKQGHGRLDALRLVQAEFRTKPKQPEWSHPYYWAAWQLSGDWKPIQGLRSFSDS